MWITWKHPSTELGHGPKSSVVVDVTSIVAIIVRINIDWFSVVHSMHLHALIHLLFPLFTFIAKMGYNGFSRPQESLLPIQKTKLKIFSKLEKTERLTRKRWTHKNGQDDGNPESSDDMQHGKYQPEQHQARVFQVHSDSQGNIHDDHEEVSTTNGGPT